MTKSIDRHFTTLISESTVVVVGNPRDGDGVPCRARAHTLGEQPPRFQPTVRNQEPIRHRLLHHDGQTN
jgi:hypothetical protein